MLFIQLKTMLENVTFRNVSMFSQNTTNTTGSLQEARFFWFHMIHLNFIFTKSFCLCHYFLDLCPPTAEELGLLCGLFGFYHELAPTKNFKMMTTKHSIRIISISMVYAVLMSKTLRKTNI